jgi:serine/threonine protein kinase
MKGGKVLASGTSGCIFKPPLLCQGKKERQKNMVTKLMTTQDAKSELDIIRYFRPIISTIPNNEDYFVLNQITECRPKSYTSEDLSSFNEKCSALTNKGITAALVESETKKGRIMGLQLPDGGEDLDEFLEANKTNDRKIIEVNKAIMKLITEGIVPMNKAGIIHNDMKASNIVYDESTNKAKIIDWGLADIVKKSSDLPLMNLPLMFNEPFTNLLFFRDKNGYIIKRRFDRFIQETTITDILKISDVAQKEKVLRLEILKWVRANFFSSPEKAEEAFGSKGVLGHFGFIRYIYFKNSVNDTINMISLQNAQVLMKFSYDKTTNTMKPFDINSFFHKVFRYNVDIYGLLTYLITISSNPKIKKVIDLVQDNLLFGEEYLTKPYNIEHVLEGIELINKDLAPMRKERFVRLGGNKTKRKTKKSKMGKSKMGKSKKVKK